MIFEQVIVLGAGSIGSVYGALLSQNNTVTLVGRPAHMNAIQDHGLHIEGDKSGTYQMGTATKISSIPPKTLLLVTVKAHQLYDALSPIRSLIQKDTVILLLQNGLGIEAAVHKILASRGLLTRGIVAFGAELLEPGRIHVRLGFTIMNSDELSKQTLQFLNDSGVQGINSENFQTDIWRKATINCVANPLSAILRTETKELVSPKLTLIRQKIVEECIEVGKAEGIEIDLSLLQIMETQFPSFENRTSMLQDILHGRQTEIDFLNGKIVELGKHHKIATPVNETITQLIRFLERQT
ncbi:MAG: ketopantoate reductase family protein [Promethearchaeota archaeon]